MAVDNIEDNYSFLEKWGMRFLVVAWAVVIVLLMCTLTQNL